MTRIAPKTKEKLRAIAKNTNRSEAYLVNEAIESYVAINEWQVALIRERLAEAEAGGATVSHDEVVRRFAKPTGKREAVSAKKVKPRTARAGS